MGLARMSRIPGRKPHSAQVDLLERMGMSETELQARRAFFELGDEDLARLRSLRGFAEKYTHEITEALYELILGQGETRAFFPDDGTIEHVKKMQNTYFLGLFAGRIDAEYTRDRLRVGATHERIGMPVKWYLGAYRRYLELIYERLAREIRDPDELRRSFASIEKIIFYDMALAIDTYTLSYVETVTRHRQAIRELSTPVIRMFNGIILMPLIGTIDTQRAQQVLETILKRVIEEKAKVLILDIAGVPVVDTKVADHLIRATAAAKLLGAQTILTGISAQIAETVVLLGVDITGMHTRSDLSDGIELALEIMGKRLLGKAA
jgi:rsbT co-antagonist protein RsbR